MRSSRASRLALAAALPALALALLPGAASAAFSPTVGIRLERDRYDVSVENLGETIVLAVETGALQTQRRVAATSYVVHGTANESRLMADYGKLGEISMRFHPSRHRTWVKPHRNCRGLGQFLVRHGTWQGRLRFRGEGGYLSLDLHRVRGTVETIAPKCRPNGHKHGSRKHGAGRHRSAKHRGRKHRHRAQRQALADQELVAPSQEPELGPEVPVLQARWREGVAGAEFVAGAGREGGVFYAASEEARGRVAVFHSARAEAKRRSVKTNDALTRAQLTPAWPFHRSASFRADPDGSRTWSGYLTVAFPGAPRYPLTGEPFKSSLELFPELLLGLIGLLSD